MAMALRNIRTCAVGVGLLCVLALGRQSVALPIPLNASFTPIGDTIPGFGSYSEVLACTPDGSILVGSATDPFGSTIAFKWSASTGLVILPANPNAIPTYSEATAINADGSVIVGISSVTGTLGMAARWTSAGIQNLGSLPALSPLSLANGVSDDGSVIIGGANTDSGLRAWRWTSATGMVNLGLWGPMSQTQAAGISGDGSTIVGSGAAQSIGAVQGFRWTTPTGYRQITDFSDGTTTRLEAKAASHNGAVIVGYGVSSRGYEAIVYTVAGGLTPLGDLPGGAYESYARAVNADGSVVVGFSTTDYGYEAFYWTADRGMVRLADLLTSYRVILNGYIPIRAQAVSADGSIIVGSAVSPANKTVAFIATIPVPAPNADWNRSGKITTQDLFDFLSDWFQSKGDFNRDGKVTVQDIFDFLAAWFNPQSNGQIGLLTPDSILTETFDAISSGDTAAVFDTFSSSKCR